MIMIIIHFKIFRSRRQYWKEILKYILKKYVQNIPSPAILPQYHSTQYHSTHNTILPQYHSTTPTILPRPLPQLRYLENDKINIKIFRNRRESFLRKLGVFPCFQSICMKKYNVPYHRTYLIDDIELKHVEVSMLLI